MNDRLTGHMQESGLRPESWKVEHGHVYVDHVIWLGPIEEVLQFLPEKIREIVEDWYAENA